ncbi:Competence protein ComM [subsurface metagenome]
MLVKTYGSAVHGINATIVTVEVNVSKGIKFYLAGLPDNPADIRKAGSAYDLPLAVGIMAAAGFIGNDELDKYVMMGELSLDGGLQPIRGVLPIAIQAREEGFKGFILPRQNAREAAVVNDLEIYGVENLKEIVDFINGEKVLEPTIVNTREEFFTSVDKYEFNFSDVKGQENVKRALEIAAASGHNIMMLYIV